MIGVDFNVDRDGIGLLSIDRPHVRNALNWSAMEAFAEAIKAAHRHRNLLALIVTGGGKAFVSGGDLSELQHYPSQADGLRLAETMGDALAHLEALACPTIAAINGPARGGGAEIAIACDLRVIAEDADIGFVHTRLGIITAWGGGQRLQRVLGYAHALYLLTTGSVLSGKEAVSLGLAHFLSPAGRALAEAWGLASRIVSNPPAAVQEAKRVLRIGLTNTYEKALEAERAAFPTLWDTDFRREAVNRFLNKKKPGKSNGRVGKVAKKSEVNQAGEI